MTKQLEKSEPADQARRQIRRLKPLDEPPPFMDMPNGGDLRVIALERAVLSHSKADDYAKDIGVLWRTAQEKFVMIGRTLEAAKNTLKHGEFENMVRTMLPFSEKTAYQLRMAAHAIESGRLPADRIPPSYTITYLLSTFDDEQLEKAEQAGLINQQVTRSQLVQFKKANTPHLAPPPIVDNSELRLERDRLVKEVQAMQRRIKEIDSLLSGSFKPTGKITEVESSS